MTFYEVKQLKREEIAVSVPASKSILSRALLLSAFTEGETVLTGCANFGQDTRDLISCLSALGIEVIQRADCLIVNGTKQFLRRAELDVGSAGTAARFLTAILAFFGGEYSFTASKQMERRPMGLLPVLEQAGVKLSYPVQADRFPFSMRSEGIAARELSVDTDVSTQYASGILLAAGVGDRPFTLSLSGSRTDGSYIATTCDVLRAFGADVSRAGNKIAVSPAKGVRSFPVVPDVSGACYFYALSLFGKRVCVRGVTKTCGQADLRFLGLLREKGVSVFDSADGIVADGRGLSSFSGFDADLRDFSDQTLTVAALAPFADSPSRLSNIGHIRAQECDRVCAILTALTALGVPCRATENDIFISPAPPLSERVPVSIPTFGDHRVAMAFSLVGLRTGNVRIENPACVRKTFGNYFEILDELTKP